MFDVTCRDGVCRIFRPETRWLSTGYDGGESTGNVVYNISVPEGWPETDLDTYVEERLAEAGFADVGPALLTGVDQQHARRARFGPVEVVATAGVSNPAELPVEGLRDGGCENVPVDSVADDSSNSDEPKLGTVNVVVGTTRSLEPGALPNLVAVAAEAKAATLLSRCGSPGTTTDAVVAACDPAGETASFSGSATEVGNAARICVRDAILASLDSRYADRELPTSVEDAQYGVVADEHATVSNLD
ncbi:adenosylcobinamide amidohydrolase [Haloferax larsenii]|uniref:Adenosylcobinamide hydrolase n=1 Tax=Haloferax larsenii TaxID=302484 RepID=A0A1H7G568_HALLR|nr:adenosylcobinamide amidohydrolase [Haloferax larsenii]SEK33453.1 adenosylcobinamide hydrolase [Haloferax larsenii]